MNKNKILFWLCFMFILLLYSGFLTYFCTAKQCDANNLVIEQDKTNVQNTSSTKKIGPEFYLSEITSFYERVITILSIIIGLILGLNFIYLHGTSKRKAEEMAIEALLAEAFKIRLQSLVAKETNEYVNELGLMDLADKIPELEKRIEFLEEQVNIQSYELSEEGSDELIEESSDEITEEGSGEETDESTGEISEESSDEVIKKDSVDINDEGSDEVKNGNN